jgi:hypothetical protein
MVITFKQLIAAAKKLNREVLEDIKAKLYWRYYNTKRSEPTFEETRAAGKRYTNCMGGVAFACKEAGIPASALQWYGNKGKIVWLNDHAKADAQKIFDLLIIKKRTVNNAVKKGVILDGDILTYMDMTHTNMFLTNGKSYDTGHAYCDGSGEGAKYRKWIGSLVYGSHKVYCIFRLKSDSIYRVQVGAYSSKENAEKRMRAVSQKSGYGCFVEQTDMYRVYCGAFEQPKNAITRLDELEESGVTKSFIVRVA